VNDIRNGILVTPTPHAFLDAREAAFLKVVPFMTDCTTLTWPILQTPNRVLNTDDVPQKYGRPLRNDIEYPIDERFTLQIFNDGERRAVVERESWAGMDAMFLRDTGLPKPSALLLHYTYGAAAVKCWGHHTELLSARYRRNIPRPSPAQATSSHAGPSSIHDRALTFKKRERHNDTAGSSKRQRGRPPKRAITSEERDEDNSDAERVVVEAVDGSTFMDEDDWMLFFALNTEEAHERRRAAEEEFSSRLTKWASEVSNNV
jgi:hypothetical protein